MHCATTLNSAKDWKPGLSQFARGTLDFMLGRASSVLAGNTWKNKGPHSRALCNLAIYADSGVFPEALRMRRSFA